MVAYYVRKTGNDNNGGTSTAVRSTGTDGVTNGTTTLTSAGAAWSAADVGHGIFIGGVNQWRKIISVSNANTLVFNGATIASASGRTWTIGGPFLTVNKGVGVMEPLDQCYVGAGLYREVVSILLNGQFPTTGETLILADRDGKWTGDPGAVVISAYLTNDLSAPSGSDAITFSNRGWVTVEGFTVIYGAGNGINMGTANSMIVRDCTVIGSGTCIVCPASTAAVGAIIERCRVLSLVTHGIVLNPATNAVADVDMNIIVRNNLVIPCRNNTAILQAPTGALAGKPGGMRVYQNVTIGGQGIVASANSSGTFPMDVRYNLCLGHATTLSAAILGQLVEDWNILIAAGPLRTNVAVGANTRTSNTAPMLHIGQEGAFGGAFRQFLTPMDGSPFLGFIPAATSPTQHAFDLRNRPRPAGGADADYAVGALERWDTDVVETTTVHVGGVPGWKLVGPGGSDRQMPVDAVSTTVGCWVRKDSTYAGSQPQLQVLDGGYVGVADASANMTVGADTWERLTLTFTPTRAGVLTIRLLSRSTAGAGALYFGEFD